MEKLIVGIRREDKVPPDRRVPLTPQQCLDVQDQYGNVKIQIQPSADRSYADAEYKRHGIELKEDLSASSIIMGIKEIPVEKLVERKTYMIFSHTIKKQPHNRKLLQAIIEKKITLIDYETLTDEEGNRIIGFGRFAGIVGAYNGLLGYGKKYDLFELKPAYLCRDRIEMEEEMRRIKLPNVKIIVTGGGRVANGAIETLGALKIRKVTPYELIHFSFREPVYAQLRSKDFHATKDGSKWSDEDFYDNPEKYRSTFEKYLTHCDILMHCAYWNPKAPKLFSKEQMKKPDFRISVIADITCDINGSIPSTHRASTIEDPFYGCNPDTEKEDVPFSKHTITVMAIDNLPCELPRDSSEAFGKHLMERVFPNLFGNDNGLIERATITKDGKLMPHFEYLQDYVDDVI